MSSGCSRSAAPSCFNRGDTFTIYFDELLKGLRRGAPLTFRGVDVGQVTEIRAIYDSATGDVRVPVTVEVRPGAVLLDRRHGRGPGGHASA